MSDQKSLHSEYDAISEALEDAISNGDGRPTAKHLLVELEHRGLMVVVSSGRVSEKRSPGELTHLLADVRDAAENWADEAEDRGRQWDAGRNPDALDEAVNRAMAEFTETLNELADAISAVPIGRGPDIGNAAPDLAAGAAQTLDVQRQAESPDPALWPHA